MRPEHLQLLISPATKKPLKLVPGSEMVGTRVKQGQLTDEDGEILYPIVDFIPRFVPADNYAKGFGYQWNMHRRTQYDASSGFPVSVERFKKETGWDGDLTGEVILEAGCGSGRFTPHALGTGANVVSFDYSNAVDANYASNGQNEQLLIVQADIYNLPFRKSAFDKVFCFGVLQHTPDARKSFMELVQYIKPGGRLASDVYLKSFKQLLFATKYKVRPFLKGMDPEKLYRWVTGYIDFMWPLATQIRKIPRYGKSINWLLLIADYSQLLKGADDKTLKEWAYLDTFDMLAPAYDNPQTPQAFANWHREAGLVDIDVHLGYNGVEGRGRRPS
jgi:SAM-dependent methyltransferase